jgi:N-acetylglucosaminyldiphosphoundecaprenol N-acetyl-beta-D-mannosaminyltransferase
MKRHFLFKNFHIHSLSKRAMLELVVEWVHARQNRQIVFANVHVAVSANEDPKLSELIKGTDLVLCDGKPLVWLCRWLKIPSDHFYGPWITLDLCELAERHAWRVAFYGATEDTQTKLKVMLKRQFPDLDICFIKAAPKLSLEQLATPEDVSAILSARPELLFVGMGWPKQELWTAEHKEMLPFPCFNVGAAFDFIAGNKSSPPKLWIRMGLGWLFRLLTDFRYTYRRYLIYNTKFIIHLLRR